jgi:protein-tyrosine phosphatase
MATIVSRFFGIGVSMWIPCRARSFPKMLLRTRHKEDSMRTELYWIEGPWRGRLAIMPRPRGGDWLEDEIQSWRRAGVDMVVSLLTREEQSELNLSDEESLCRANSIEFVSFPIVDRGVPSSAETFSEQVIKLAEQLANGRNIAVHCRQGIGRAALVAICLLAVSGIAPTAAIERVGKARGCPVPETSEQRRWIMDFATSLVTGIPK